MIKYKLKSQYLIFKKVVYLAIFISVPLFLASCAHAPLKSPSLTVAGPSPVLIPRQDIQHIVAPGETLFRISKMYDVSISDIMRKNGLINPNELEMGQSLVVPRAAPQKSVIPLYPSKKWKYIIVHHSATDEGSALSLFYMHKKRGFSGLGYHFVIDNGSSTKVNGQIEASPRWIHQQDGAHCKASQMNYTGIGICLVGNFSKERLSEEQLNSLVYLVNTLRRYYHVPLSNIMGHGQVPGARTECPGIYFPWKKFKSLLR